jgi:hypothetical protein
MEYKTYGPINSHSCLNASISLSVAHVLYLTILPWGTVRICKAKIMKK